MKKVIISALTIILTGCSTIWDKLEKPLIAPKVNEQNYWKIPCFVDGIKLKKPYATNSD